MYKMGWFHGELKMQNFKLKPRLKQTKTVSVSVLASNFAFSTHRGTNPFCKLMKLF